MLVFSPPTDYGTLRAGDVEPATLSPSWALRGKYAIFRISVGGSTYFIGYMLPTFGIICNLGVSVGPSGPVLGIPTWDICIFRHYSTKVEKFALNVACPQCRLPSTSSVRSTVFLYVVGLLQIKQNEEIDELRKFHLSSSCKKKVVILFKSSVFTTKRSS